MLPRAIIDTTDETAMIMTLGGLFAVKNVASFELRAEDGSPVGREEGDAVGI